jgi:dTDP-4-dehydrorhamnose reductase
VKVVVVGANGQLGCDLMAAFADEDLVGLTHADIDLCATEVLQEIIVRHAPDIVVNTAAYHHVEKCEQNPATSFAVNATGAWNLARACGEAGAVLVHVSTDYVFDGAKVQPYVEDDLPAPLNVYGASKLAGEHLIDAVLERAFIVRTSGLYGLHPCRAKGGDNFVELMLRLASERDEVKVVNDEFVTPTFTSDLAAQIRNLAGSRRYGAYHATAEGECSWYEFAEAIFILTGADVRLTQTTADEFPRPVARPSYSVLENAALKEENLNVMRPWREALADYLSLRVTQQRGNALS